MPRRDLRRADQLRPVRIERGYQRYPAGSALIEMGHTRVVCAATVEERVPFFLKGSGTGWVTAEYSMLPGAGSERTAREAMRGHQTGRTQEIQRLIGRALRTLTVMCCRQTAGHVQHRLQGRSSRSWRRARPFTRGAAFSPYVTM